MFVTTSARADNETEVLAKKLAKKLKSPFIDRGKRSVNELQVRHGEEDCLVLGKNRMELYRFGEEEPFFFHPNLAMIRIKRLMKGEKDPLLDVMNVEEGESLLDCTLGLGADSIVASFALGGQGRVIALEKNPILALIVKQGLKEWEDADQEMMAAMRRIEVIQTDHYDYLRKLPDNQVDYVYFDPMFEENISESNGIKGLTHFASGSPLTEEIIKEAKRVARKKVIMKDHFRSTRFEQYGFEVIKRKTSKFHFGFIPVLNQDE